MRGLVGVNFLMVGYAYARAFFIYGFATTPQERNFDISLAGTLIATLKTEPLQPKDKASLHINTKIPA